MRLLATAIAALLCSGCFVNDELESGQESTGQSSPQATPSNAGAAPPPANTPQARLQQLREQYGHAPPPETDPENVIVRCTQGGVTQYTRKFDCQARGGRISM